MIFSGTLRIHIYEEHALIDFLRGSLVVSGQRIPLFEFDNGDYTQTIWFAVALPPVDVTAYAGQELTLEFESELGAGPGTDFYLDELSLVSDCLP